MITVMSLTFTEVNSVHSVVKLMGSFVINLPPVSVYLLSR